MGETIEAVERVEVAPIEVHLAFDAGRKRGLEGSVATVGEGRAHDADRPQDRRAHAPIRLVLVRSGCGSRPDWVAMISATIDTALSAGVRVPRSRPVGQWSAATWSSVAPASCSSRTSSGLHAARAEGADVADVGLQRGHEYGVGDLVLVLEHDDGIAGAELSDRSQALVEIGRRPARPVEQRGLACELPGEGLDADEEQSRGLARRDVGFGFLGHRRRRLAIDRPSAAQRAGESQCGSTTTL